MTLEALFAPWRMSFIEKHDDKKGCVLCQISETKSDQEMQILKRGKTCFVVMNKYPYATGHLMVIPYRHESNWTELKENEILELSQLTQQAIRALTAAFKPEGFNLGVNLGRAAGAGIEGHVHQHIVPRWSGDVNFMPLFAEVKVISEHLEETYRRLVKAWPKD
jgi:ATP adenylyltransferase